MYFFQTDLQRRGLNNTGNNLGKFKNKLDFTP